MSERNIFETVDNSGEGERASAEYENRNDRPVVAKGMNQPVTNDPMKTVPPTKPVIASKEANANANAKAVSKEPPVGFKAPLNENAILQQKKNKVRALIAQRGFLKKGATNTYDKYDYFSEAQYKDLFVELFSACGVEFYATIEKIEELQGTSGMPFGRRVTVLVVLIDIETGFEEASNWVGEAFDKTDKALYKAYTGAVKYYLATTFHVPTGDDPEADKRKPDEKEEPQLILPWHMKVIKTVYNTPELMAKFLQANGIETLEAMPYEMAVAKVDELNALAKKKRDALADATPNAG